MPGMPVYVKIDEYKEVLDLLKIIRARLEEAKETLNRINELKNSEDSELEGWGGDIDEVERKIDFIDRTLFEPERL
ncbi:MAG: hypothetical protein Q7J54_01785 [Candidatus Woesearchaeota archaeon]|nr:hypothetical protein [Candidatus Woesearchaeota archaeon]